MSGELRGPRGRALTPSTVNLTEEQSWREGRVHLQLVTEMLVSWSSSHSLTMESFKGIAERQKQIKELRQALSHNRVRVESRSPRVRLLGLKAWLDRNDLCDLR